MLPLLLRGQIDQTVQDKVLSQLEQLYHQFTSQGGENKKEPLVRIFPQDYLSGLLCTTWDEFPNVHVYLQMYEDV